MQTPDLFSKEELMKSTRRNEIVRLVVNQIIKDFGSFNIDLKISDQIGDLYDSLQNKLEIEIARICQENNTVFKGLLYRIDISEKEITQYQQEMPQSTFFHIISQLIIHRELKKVLYREYYKNK